MKKDLAILLMLAIPCAVFAQSVKYTYDNAGNRVKREIVMMAKALRQKAGATECHSDIISGKDIRIYTNPTKGRLGIEIMGYDNSDLCVFRIFNVSGQQILSTHVVSPRTEVNISSQPNCVYFLHISLNNKENTWKIIKK